MRNIELQPDDCVIIITGDNHIKMHPPEGIFDEEFDETDDVPVGLAIFSILTQKLSDPDFIKQLVEDFNAYAEMSEEEWEEEFGKEVLH